MFPSLKFRVWCQIIISIVSFYFFFFFFYVQRSCCMLLLPALCNTPTWTSNTKLRQTFFVLSHWFVFFFVCLFILATLCCFFFFNSHWTFSKKWCFIIILHPMYIVNLIVFTSTKEVMFFTCVCSWLVCHQNYTKTIKWITTKLGWRIILGPE